MSLISIYIQFFIAQLIFSLSLYFTMIIESDINEKFISYNIGYFTISFIILLFILISIKINNR